MNGISEMRQSALRLYKGKVMHQRHGALTHRLNYDVFSVCLDLDRASEAQRDIPFFSFNNFNLFSLHEKDHMDEGYEDLRLFVLDMLGQSGLYALSEAMPRHIEMLAYPRLIGRAFNPLSVFFCYDDQRQLSAILYQVRNTFGERHHYAFRVDVSGPAEAQTHKHSCSKNFYVSPFIEMDCRYNFKVREPRDDVSIVIHQTQDEQPLLTAAFQGKLRSTGRLSMLGLALSSFQSGWKILAAIHWEALKLWLKGAVYQQRPEAPSQPVSTSQSAELSHHMVKGEIS